jgi:DNA-binding MurR/RpiR family transcriptional regulator
MEYLEMNIQFKPPQDNLNEVKNMENSVDCFCRIRERYSSMTKSQKSIAKYIRTHQNDFLTNSITILAKKIGTNPSAISRFCQALNYKGLSDMKFSLENDLYSPLNHTGLVEKCDNTSTIKKKFLNLYVEALKDTLLRIDDHIIERAAHVLCNAKSVYIYCNGSSGASANYVYQLLLQTGIPCNFFIDKQLALISVGHLQKGDVAIGISYSGSASAVSDALTLAKSNNVTTIGITAHSNSSLAKISDILLSYSMKIEDDLRYLHIARMCELAIIGQLQASIISFSPQQIQDNLIFSKMAIEKSRTNK